MGEAVDIVVANPEHLQGDEVCDAGRETGQAKVFNLEHPQGFQSTKVGQTSHDIRLKIRGKSLGFDEKRRYETGSGSGSNI